MTIDIIMPGGHIVTRFVEGRPSITFEDKAPARAALTLDARTLPIFGGNKELS